MGSLPKLFPVEVSRVFACFNPCPGLDRFAVDPVYFSQKVPITRENREATFGGVYQLLVMGFESNYHQVWFVDGFRANSPGESPSFASDEGMIPARVMMELFFRGIEVSSKFDAELQHLF